MAGIRWNQIRWLGLCGGAAASCCLNIVRVNFFVRESYAIHFDVIWFVRNQSAYDQDMGKQYKKCKLSVIVNRTEGKPHCCHSRLVRLWQFLFLLTIFPSASARAYVCRHLTNEQKRIFGDLSWKQSEVTRFLGILLSTQISQLLLQEAVYRLSKRKKRVRKTKKISTVDHLILVGPPKPCRLLFDSFLNLSTSCPFSEHLPQIVLSLSSMKLL